ncbi:MAG: hypothetical protein A3H37_09470 [Candidatus Schekmanbacteria bacterium RIFCSPLOWO2_02_FULL_38_14]|nr:MAG: hypothetical protein A3H37_09470 [Candidatus Schekmanbacteria bacterium RIFCSPLOWO2_02_FULL_38_14]
MAQTADCIIIGGGIIGISIAYNLVKCGLKNVILLEKKEFLGTGSTAKSAGGIRHQHSTEINIRMTLESVKILKTFEDEMEVNIDFRQHGYLLLAASEITLSELKKNAKLQKSLGVEVSLLSPIEIKTIVPQLNIDDILGGTFCHQDGYLDPNGLMYGYSKNFKKLGGEILTSTEVTGIKVKNGKVFSAVTNKGEIQSDIIINAAGPYGGKIAEMSGLKLPLTPLKRQVFVTDVFKEISPTTPMVIDLDAPFYFRPEQSGAILMSMADKQETSGFDTTLDWSLLEKVVEKAIHRVPVLENAKIITGWAGLRTLTPDQNAILGEVAALKGFICAAGFSGHGITHAPIAGKLISELIIDGKTETLPIIEMSPERFADGKSGYANGVI